MAWPREEWIVVFTTVKEAKAEAAKVAVAYAK